MTDHAGYECNPVFQIVTREICNLVLKFHNPMKSFGTRRGKKYNTAHRGPQFIIGLHNNIIRFVNFSLGYAILILIILIIGYKFCGCLFEIPGYTRTAGSRRGLSYTPRSSLKCVICFLIKPVCFVFFPYLVGQKLSSYSHYIQCTSAQYPLNSKLGNNFAWRIKSHISISFGYFCKILVIILRNFSQPRINFLQK